MSDAYTRIELTDRQATNEGSGVLQTDPLYRRPETREQELERLLAYARKTRDQWYEMWVAEKKKREEAARSTAQPIGSLS